MPDPRLGVYGLVFTDSGVRPTAGVCVCEFAAMGSVVTSAFIYM